MRRALAKIFLCSRTIRKNCKKSLSLQESLNALSEDWYTARIFTEVLGVHCFSRRWHGDEIARKNQGESSSRYENRKPKTTYFSCHIYRELSSHNYCCKAVYFYIDDALGFAKRKMEESNNDFRLSFTMNN